MNGKPKLISINHVALEVGDVAVAPDFYGRIFDFELRGRHEDDQGRTTMAFIDMGHQFLALSEGRRQNADSGRHFGLVVDDRSVIEAVKAAGGEIADGPFTDFRDPWGNRVEIVAYRDVQFSKLGAVMDRLNAPTAKSESTRQELRGMGIEPNG